MIAVSSVSGKPMAVQRGRESLATEICVIVSQRLPDSQGLTLRLLCAGLAILVGWVVHPTWAEEPPGRASSRPAAFSWDDGLRPEWRSERFSLRFGGKAMGDVGWADASGVEGPGAALEDRSESRRLRPFVSGSVADRLDFKLEGEFAGPGTRWMDLYLRLRDPRDTLSLTAGHFKEPFGLEQLTSSADTTFLERALPDAFTPGRSVGAMVHGEWLDRRATWSLGLFRSLNGETCFPDGRGGEASAVTGRATWLAWRSEETNDLVHLGASYSFRSLRDDARYRQRPEVQFAGYVTDTGRFAADATHLLGTEAAWVRGPLSLQGEYLAACADRPEDTNAFLHGFYVQGSYFLTGESRPYDGKTGVFTGLKPRRPFPTKGVGAWEIATRYSFLDLGASGLPETARQVQDFTVGLNWYLNPNLRLGWNYVRSWIDGADLSGAADLFVFRVQLAF